MCHKPLTNSTLIGYIFHMNKINELRKVELKGNPFSLNIIERNFKNARIFVFSEEKNDCKTFYLKSNLFDNLEKEELKNRSHSLMIEINAICSFAIDHFVPVEVGDVYIGNCIFIEFFDQITIKDYLSIVENGKEIFLEDELLSNILVKAKKDDLLSKILVLYYEKGNNWINLYRILEIFEDMNIDVVKNKWISKDEKRLLKQTANSPMAIGNEARHGKQSGKPPPEPMSLNMAQILVKKIVSYYCESLN